MSRVRGQDSSGAWNAPPPGGPFPEQQPPIPHPAGGLRRPYNNAPGHGRSGAKRWRGAGRGPVQQRVGSGPARRKRQASGAAPPVSKGGGDRHNKGPVPRNNCRKRAATLVAAVPEWPRRPALPGSRTEGEPGTGRTEGKPGAGRSEGEPGTGRSEGKPGTDRSEGKPGTGRVRGRTWRRRTRCGAARVRRCRRHPSRRHGPGRAGSCRTCSSRRRSAPAAAGA